MFVRVAAILSFIVIHCPSDIMAQNSEGSREAAFLSLELDDYQGFVEALDGASSKNEQLSRLLMLAAKNGKTRYVSHLISIGVDADARTSDEVGTPLLEAAAAGHMETVQYLLDVGADPERVSKDGTTLSYALELSGTEETPGLPLDQSKEDHAAHFLGKTALAANSYGSNSKETELLELISQGKLRRHHLGLVDTFIEFEGGLALLHVAAAVGKPNQVELFVLRNADLNIEDEVFGWTPLQVAEVFGHQEAAEILKVNGAVYSSNNLKAFEDLVGSADNPSEERLQAENYASALNNLLLFAAEINDPDMVEQLISLGADPLYSSNNGWTPLMYTAMQRGVESDAIATIEVLSKSVDSPRSYFRLADADGNTPLLIALSMNASRGVVEALVNKGGVPENPNKFGFSAKNTNSDLLPENSVSPSRFPSLAMQARPSVQNLLQPDMSIDSWKQIQIELKKFDLYQGKIDGLPGSGTRAGLYAYHRTLSDIYREIGLNFCSAAADLIANDEYMRKALLNSPHANVRNEISQQGMNGRLKITLPFGSVIYAKKDGSRRIESLRQTSAQLGSATYVCGYRRVEEPEVGPILRLISFRVGEQHQYVFLWKECSNLFEFEIMHGRDTVLREDTCENKVLGLSSAGKQSVIWADL